MSAHEGNLFKVKCTTCGCVNVNTDRPICEALRGRGGSEPGTVEARIPAEELPRCGKKDCGGLLRPHVVWFGEQLERLVIRRVNKEMAKCDLCLVVGTSSVVNPVAMFAPKLANWGIPVAEFNLEETPETGNFAFHFSGPCGTTLKEALARHPKEPKTETRLRKK